MHVCYLCFPLSLQILKFLPPVPTSHLDALSCAATGDSLLRENADYKKNKLSAPAYSQKFPATGALTNEVSKHFQMKAPSSHHPTPTAGWTFPDCTQHTLEETKNSQMAINRSSKEGRWGRPQQGQFPGWLPNGALSQQCSGQERVFIKTA